MRTRRTSQGTFGARTWFVAIIGLAGASCKAQPPPPPVPAEIQWRDGGAGEGGGGAAARGGGAMFVRAATSIMLPTTDLARGQTPPVVSDATGKRYAYGTAGKEERVVYLVGDGIYLGPKLPVPFNFDAAPDVEGALGALFDNAGDAQAGALTHDVQSTLGDSGLASMLAGAESSGKRWDDTYAALSPAAKAALAKKLEPLLARGAPTVGLVHAVTVLPLAEPSRADALAARAGELSDPPRELGAVAIMLRALARVDGPRAATVACDALGKVLSDPKATLKAKDRLVEAAALALASDAAAGHPPRCPALVTALGEDPCLPWFRCQAGHPLWGREPTKQDEPLCTLSELQPVIADELARPATDVLAEARPPHGALFAYAALSAGEQLPASFLIAQGRRRYALNQPASPPCDSRVTPGQPCHCDEATIRDQACRQPTSNPVNVALCRYTVDDKAKTMGSTVASLPP